MSDTPLGDRQADGTGGFGFKGLWGPFVFKVLPKVLTQFPQTFRPGFSGVGSQVEMIDRAPRRADDLPPAGPECTYASPETIGP